MTMCLAIPAKVIELKDDRLATVDILGVTRDISLDLTPQAAVGDFVLVHAGFSIEVVDPDFAQETIDLIREFPDLAGDEIPA
jgi:hydrogenase expression/formation protein HypC